MVLKEWGEIRQLYKATWPFKAIWGYWYVWVFCGLLILSTLIVEVLVIKKDWPVWAGVLLMAPFACFLRLAIVRALAKEFQVEYTTHGIARLPWWQRPWYLRYALFLLGLSGRGYSREMVEKLSTFAAMAGKPELDYRILQHPAMVPLITIITVLSIEAIKQTEIWQKTSYWWIFLWGSIVLGFVVAAVLSMSQVRKSKNRTIQRFLQWAERDIEEAERRRRLGLDAVARDAHGPQHPPSSLDRP